MEILLMVHSLWRWLVVIAAVLAVAGAAVARGANARRGDPPGWARRTGLIYTIVLDTQFLIGMILWSAGSWWQGGAYYAYIHPLIMLLALGVAHMGRARERRGKAGAIFAYAGSFALLMLGIPWNS